MDAYNANASGVKTTFANTELDHIKPLAEFNRQGSVHGRSESMDSALHHYTTRGQEGMLC